MQKYSLIAIANMRKAKGQNISITILILLAALMLNLWLILAMDYTANFDRYHTKLNAEHVTLALDDADGEVRTFLNEELEKDHAVTEFLLDPCLHMTGGMSYNGGEVSSWFVFFEKETALTRSVGRAEIVEEGDCTSGVYLPMLYKTEDIDIGKTIDLKIGSHVVTYTVCGFFNSVMAGSHNCVIMEVILTDDKYKELETLGYAPKGTLCSVRLNDSADSLNFEASLKSRVSEKFSDIVMVSNCYGIVSQSRYISQMICSGVLSAMAFIILLIALVVIASNIMNYIQTNMKNLGALKAIGYTSKQLISTLLLQFTGLTLLVSMIGAALSYALLPALNQMMIAQTGIPYAIHFLPLPFFLSLGILCGAVTLVVWYAAGRIKKIEAITALRSGVQTHNFKCNHIALEKTKAPLHLALALKTTLSSMKHNVTICITMLVLSLVVVFSGLMIQNMILDMSSFLNLIVGEMADSCINVQVEAEDQFLNEMTQDDRVEKVYLFTSINISHADGAELLASVCNDFSLLNNQNVVFEGRFPKYDNEIALAAKYAKEHNMRIGDEITIKGNGKQETYLICGYTQLSNNLGRDCLLTREGYEKLGSLTNTSYYINLADGADIDAFNLDIKESLGSDVVNTTINIEATVEGSAKVYVMLMTIIVIAILVLSAIVIVFVLYLLVRTMLNHKMRDYGILKALGFTTGQLILQTALSFMPTVILSTVVGLFVSSLVINPLTAVFLNGIGVVKCTFTVPVGFNIAAGIGLVGFTFAAACLLSLKIRKIAPRELLCGE
ncbi:MAG: ABC transporter permease [Clostridia bacterium]|nr:ABC transporter permease [Clostridia bacterium]